MLESLFGSRSTLLDAAFRDISAMLDRGAEMFDIALATLLDNEPMEADLDRMDDQVDQGERLVRRSVLEHLSVNPQQDLVASLVLASMVQDAERIGDFARGLGELVELAGSPREGRFRDELAASADQLRPLFGLCREAFRDDVPDKAREVTAVHARQKQELIELTRQIAASDLTADMAVVYAGSARILRRIGAHLANIASTVTQPYDQIRHGDEDA